MAINILQQLKAKIETELDVPVAAGRIREGYDVAIRDDTAGDTLNYLNQTRERNKTFIVFSQDCNETIARDRLSGLFDVLYGLGKDDFEQIDFCVNFVEATDPFFIDYTDENKMIYAMNLNVRFHK